MASAPRRKAKDRQSDRTPPYWSERAYGRAHGRWEADPADDGPRVKAARVVEIENAIKKQVRWCAPRRDAHPARRAGAAATDGTAIGIGQPCDSISHALARLAAGRSRLRSRPTPAARTGWRPTTPTSPGCWPPGTRCAAAAASCLGAPAHAAVAAAAARLSSRPGDRSGRCQGSGDGGGGRVHA